MRPDWDDYFLDLVERVGARTTCLRRSVGAIFVKDNFILTTGYNGVPAGLYHCADLENGCLRNHHQIVSGEDRWDVCRAIHAEQNGIAQAARRGISLEGSTLYISIPPCVICARLIINTGIIRVVAATDYPSVGGKKVLAEAQIPLNIKG